MIRNVTGIKGDPEKSELDVMTFHDVIIVANERRETRCGSWYKYPCVQHVQSVEQVGTPSSPKPVVGMPN